MQKHPLITIITPTYNRAHLLRRCYESLLRQVDKDFEWIIVDDGSSDDTEMVVRQFASDDFSICYIRKENGGKHTALNASHTHIRGQYVLILDSDDYLTDTAIAVVRREWEKYGQSEKIGIITFLRGKTTEDPLCRGTVVNQPVDLRTCKREIIHGNDCCEVIRADLFMKYPFPVFDGERFVSECALWDRVAETHDCVYVNEVIYICEYLEGGLTKTGKKLQISNPRGGMFTSNQRMGKEFPLLLRVKNGLLYTCYGCFAGITLAELLRNSSARVLTILCLPGGRLLHYYWKKKYL